MTAAEITRSLLSPATSPPLVRARLTACGVRPLGNLIDLGAEKARLEKAIEKAKAEAGRIQGKLSNEKFVANAKPEVVEAERERFAELEQQLASLAVALARVSEAG